MMWFWVVALVLVVGAVAVFAAGRDNAMAETYDDRPDRTIPTGRPLTADDLMEVRFSSALRGYRMDEVDALLDRIAADLMSREQHRRPEAEAEAEAKAEAKAGVGRGQRDSAEEAQPPGSHRADAADAGTEATTVAPAQSARADDAPRDTPRDTPGDALRDAPGDAPRDVTR